MRATMRSAALIGRVLAYLASRQSHALGADESIACP